MHHAITRSIQSWTASALIHGLAFGAAMTLLSDLPKLAQREPFVWTVSLVEPPPASIQPPTIQPPPPPTQARAAQPTPTQARLIETTPIVRAIQSVPQIQQVHEVVRREVREPRPVLQEVVRAERLPAPHAHELVQRDTSEARPPVQEAGPLTQQTQQVVSQAPSSIPTNRQEVSVATQSAPATQSIGTAQSVQVSQRPTPAPATGLIAVASTPSGPPTSSVMPGPPHPDPIPPAPAHPSPLEQAKAQSNPTPIGLPTPTNLRTKADYGWLARELWNRVERLKRYPRLARVHGWEGKVVVRAVIKADGSLAHEAIEESSGYEALDQDALDLMKQVCPLALKHQLGQPQIVVHVPIHYRIEQ